jgi:DNA-directed RNA polymerase specialized sigma24 family protein
MAGTNVNDCRESFEHVLEKYHRRLRRYFLVQLGDAVDVEACVEETVRRLFDFMKSRRWEREADNINAYLMRIAFGVCSRKQAEESPRGSLVFRLGDGRRRPRESFRDDSP